MFDVSSFTCCGKCISSKKIVKKENEWPKKAEAINLRHFFFFIGPRALCHINLLFL